MREKKTERGGKVRLRVMLRRGAIRARVRELGTEITRDFRGKRVHLIGVLKGASIFFADLVREIDLEVSLDFVAVSSYGKGTRSSGEVKLTKDLDARIEALNVLLVEDILDTGLTMNYLMKILKQRAPKTLRTVALLDKPSRRVVKGLEADYVGFRIADKFVVGYGLDYAEKYRNLKDVCVLEFAEPRGSEGKEKIKCGL